MTRPLISLRQMTVQVGLLATAIYVAVGIPRTGGVTGGPTLCPIRLCTGHACPGCGLTRSIGTALRGDLGMSFRYHPLGVAIALQALVAWAWLLTDRASLLRRRWLIPLLVVNGIAIFATWVTRWRFGLLDFVLADG